MRRPAPARHVLALLLAVALTAGCRDSSAPIERVDMQDLPAPAMAQDIALHLKMPYVIEIPLQPAGGRFDLKLDHVTLDEVLAKVEALDPEFTVSRTDGVITCRPAKKADLEKSPFSKTVATLETSGGAGEVLRLVLVEAGLADSTNMYVETSGLRRPVTLKLKDATVRDAFAEVARQAHVGFMVAPGTVNVLEVPQ